MINLYPNSAKRFRHRRRNRHRPPDSDPLPSKKALPVRKIDYLISFDEKERRTALKIAENLREKISRLRCISAAKVMKKP